MKGKFFLFTFIILSFILMLCTVDAQDVNNRSSTIFRESGNTVYWSDKYTNLDTSKYVSKTSNRVYTDKRINNIFDIQAVPARGYWSGENDLGGRTRFTVSADRNYVCGFYMYFPGVDGACGLISSDQFICFPIDTSTFGLSLGDPPANEVRVDGVFASDSMINGTWHASKSSPYCNISGEWTANAIQGGHFNCNQDGFVEVCIWVNNPNPKRREHVVVYVQLLDNGIGQNDLPINIVWNDDQGNNGSGERQTGSDGLGLARYYIYELGEDSVTDLVIEAEIEYAGRTYTTSIMPLATAIDKKKEPISLTLFELFQNYPNPFSSSTIISYQLPVISDVELSVYDLLGQKVTTLVKERQQLGSYEIEWNAESMNPGIYWCELKTGQSRKVMKMILLRE